MSREIWNSNDGFVGGPVDFLELIHCLSCMNQKNCPFVKECGIDNNFEHYFKDVTSKFAKLVD